MRALGDLQSTESLTILAASSSTRAGLYTRGTQLEALEAVLL